MSEPVFEFSSNNPFGLSSLSNLADIDHDGDLDVFAGDFSGNTRFFKNTGTATNPTFAAPVNNPFGLANVGAPRCMQRGAKLRNFEN